MVALSSLSPRAGTLLRHGSRFAGRLDTSWFVVYVETPAEAPERIDAAAERALLANVELARALGAEVVRLKARDPLAALLDLGRSHGVRHIVLGRSRRRAWRELLRRAPGEPPGAALRAPFHERLLRQARDFDVYVVAQEEDA
jgi:two-component system sensor histidine kinase KdpD